MGGCWLVVSDRNGTKPVVCKNERREGMGNVKLCRLQKDTGKSAGGQAIVVALAEACLFSEERVTFGTMYGPGFLFGSQFINPEY